MTHCSNIFKDNFPYNTRMLSQKREILRVFPFDEIQLSYEIPVHKKVHNAHLTMAIPDGHKSYAWFTVKDDTNICYIMEKANGTITNITCLTTEFSVKLSYGTIFYGTFFKSKNGLTCFSVEDLLFLKGKNVSKTPFLNKLHLLNDLFKREELKNPEVLFGLPTMDEQFYTVLNAVPELPYKSSFIHFRYLEGKYSNTAFIMKYIKPRQQNNIIPHPLKKESIFHVVADIQPDVYHLTAPDGTKSIACIPSYEASVMMNRIFRNIKENNNLDALEESDDEEDFENTHVDKYIVRKESLQMKCHYHHKFKKWVPSSVIE